MSSDIWKIGQETNAQQMYENVKTNGIQGGIFRVRGDVVAVQHLTAICNRMIEAYDDVLKDQNDYLVELETDAASFDELKEDISEKIKALYAEIEALSKKEKNGTITEEEKKELEDKKGELSVLMQDSDAKVNDQIAKTREKSDKKTSEHKSKISIAKNYGEVTVEKGTPLAQTEVKTKSFWRSIFGGTNQKKHDVGVKAVETGKDLLDKVGESVEINNQIEKNSKNFKVK